MWKVNVCEYTGNDGFKHVLPCCYPVARDKVGKCTRVGSLHL